MTLFTQVRGRLIFRSPYTVSCIGPRYSDESAASNTKDQKADHHVLRVRIKMRSGAYASSRQHTDYAGAG
jgi:hypothetical protein